MGGLRRPVCFVGASANDAVVMHKHLTNSRQNRQSLEKCRLNSHTHKVGTSYGHKAIKLPHLTFKPAPLLPPHTITPRPAAAARSRSHPVCDGMPPSSHQEVSPLSPSRRPFIMTRYNAKRTQFHVGINNWNFHFQWSRPVCSLLVVGLLSTALLSRYFPCTDI